MKQLIFAALIFLLAACTSEPKEFPGVFIGMTSQEVLEKAGPPSAKRNIGLADLWVYKEADRTVVFREDTVYDIIISAEARIDSKIRFARTVPFDLSGISW